MSDYQYNDNELLYLISQKDDDALEILIKKYEPLINKRLRSYRVNKINYEDYFQECLIALVNAVNRFREDKNGVFNLYLDYAIQSKIKTLLRKDKQYFYSVSVVNGLEYITQDSDNNIYKVKEEMKIGKLSDWERSVYRKYIDEKTKPKDIAKLFSCDIKKVYNTLSRIREKLREDFPKQIQKIKYYDSKFVDRRLTKLESEVYFLYVNGKSVDEISEKLGYEKVKTINALSRAKRKLANKK